MKKTPENYIDWSFVYNKYGSYRYMYYQDYYFICRDLGGDNGDYYDDTVSLEVIDESENTIYSSNMKYCQVDETVKQIIKIINEINEEKI